MRLLIPTVVAIAACRPGSVDEACKNHIGGQGSAEPDEVEIFSRVTCYRKYVGLDQANINSRITEAAAAHANYLELNETLSSQVAWTSWPYEVPGAPGYTGETSFDRLDATEYFVEGITDTAFVWELILLLEEGQTYEELVDAYMIDPFFRDALLAPSWHGGGFGEAVDPVYGSFGYMNIVLYFPSGARSTRPVVYPQDGQTDVPTTWNRLFEDPNIELPLEVGFPITFTMGSSTIGAGLNPLEVEVVSSSMHGPSGAVDHIVLLPGSYGSGLNWSTAILVPTEPLEPQTTYTVDATLSWIDRPNRDESLTFTTGADVDTTPAASVTTPPDQG